MNNISLKEIWVILFAAIILGFTISFPDNSKIISSIIYFIIIILINVVAKKIISYNLEIDLSVNFWSWHRFGLRKDAHFKNPLPMLWLPLFLAYISKGLFLWLGILNSEISAKTERVTKRHGLYRFTQVTEWHIAIIMVFGIAANIFFAIIGYFFASWIPGLENFARFSIYFAFWSLIPIGSLDGTKIFFGSRTLWFTTATIVTIFLLIALMIP